MGLTLVNAAGPEVLHGPQYSLPSSAWSVTDTPAPPQGRYWIKCESQTTATQADIVPGHAFDPAPDFIWLVCRAFRIVTTMPTNSALGIFRWQTVANNGTDPRQLVAQGLGTGKWRLQLRQQSPNLTLALGRTQFDYDTDVALRLEWDGSTVRVWANDSLEISYRHPSAAPSNNLIPLFGLATGQTAPVTRLWRGLAMFTGTSRDNRPDTDVEVNLHLPNSDPGELSDYGDQDEPSNPAAGSYVNWNDYASEAGGGKVYPYAYPREYTLTSTPGLADDDETYNLSPSELDKAEASGLSDETYTKPIRGVKQMFWSANASGNKAYACRGLLRYNGTNLFKTLSGTTDIYTAEAAVYDSPPGGGSWSQALMDALQAGHASPESGTTLEKKVSAMAIEGVGVSPDPPPPKRLLQVI